MAAQKGKSKWSDGDGKLLNRQKDGLIIYFGKHDVTKITTGMIREYLLHLDDNRDRPLAQSTKSKHVVIIRKVLSLPFWRISLPTRRCPTSKPISFSSSVI
ncbi:hypothetical protein Q4539_15475, partial [Yoonia sp. 1_MG-2023]|nr:hypothetical protein [Yoonia sp. 1_MG-2023]